MKLKEVMREALSNAKSDLRFLGVLFLIPLVLLVLSLRDPSLLMLAFGIGLIILAFVLIVISESIFFTIWKKSKSRKI